MRLIASLRAYNQADSVSRLNESYRRVPMLELYVRLLKRLSSAAVEAAVWKNAHEVDAALLGDGDIDLYIRPTSRQAFLQVLTSCGFVEALSPYSYPSVAHYYGYDKPSGKLCHLHCYFRLVTGESHIKQFVLPLEAYLAGTDLHCHETSFARLDGDLQRSIAEFRRQIKVSCLPGLWLYLRERDGYREERRQLVAGASERPPLFDGWLGTVRERGSLTAAMLGGLSLRWQLRSYSRLPALRRIWMRYTSIALRAVNRFRGHGKRLPQGIIVAVTGLDGSGKSTAVAMLADWFSPHLEVHVLHYGRAAPTVLTWPFRIALALRAQLPGLLRQHSLESREGERYNVPSGWLVHLRYVALAWERHRVASHAHRLANAGAIVVTDRWHTLERGRMDGRRLDPSRVRGLRRWLARFEEQLYAHTPKPDLLLCVRVNLKTAQARNRARDKPGKESDSEIAMRFLVNGAVTYRASTIVDIDGECVVGTVHAAIRTQVWQFIARNNA